MSLSLDQLLHTWRWNTEICSFNLCFLFLMGLMMDRAIGSIIIDTHLQTMSFMQKHSTLLPKAFQTVQRLKATLHQ